MLLKCLWGSALRVVFLVFVGGLIDVCLNSFLWIVMCFCSGLICDSFTDCGLECLGCCFTAGYYALWRVL